MTLPSRLIPFLEWFGFTVERLVNRMAGPGMTSGDGMMVKVASMTDEESFWGPVPQYWTAGRLIGSGAAAEIPRTVLSTSYGGSITGRQETPSETRSN
jgi:hypothetical protein